MSDYPRDMVGYGERPPDPHWPGGARIAVSFVLNYEEGGEMNVLHGDPASEAYIQEIPGILPRQGERDPGVESIYEYGSRAGFWRIHRTFTARQVPLTVYAVGMALERNPAAGRAMAAAGWEVASHGYRWIDYATKSEAEERADIQRTIALTEQIVGTRPVGWYCGRTSANTRRLVAEEGGFLYDSDNYADDLPYWTTVEGRPHLIIPYSLDNNDFKFAILHGFSHGEEFYAHCRDAFDVLYEEGATQPKMMSIGLHCRLIGRPGRTRALERLIDYMRGHDGVWLCRRADIARHWRQHFPYQPG